MENNFSAENSLRLISETIERSRRTIAKNAGKPLILWGTLVTVTSLVIWLLWSKTGSPAWNFLWFAMSAIGVICGRVMDRGKEKAAVTEVTHTLGKDLGVVRHLCHELLCAGLDCLGHPLGGRHRRHPFRRPFDGHPDDDGPLRHDFGCCAQEQNPCNLFVGGNAAVCALPDGHARRLTPPDPDLRHPGYLRPDHSRFHPAKQQISHVRERERLQAA